MIFNDVELLPSSVKRSPEQNLIQALCLAKYDLLSKLLMSGRLMNTSACSGLAVAQFLVPKRKAGSRQTTRLIYV